MPKRQKIWLVIKPPVLFWVFFKRLRKHRWVSMGDVVWLVGISHVHFMESFSEANLNGKYVTPQISTVARNGEICVIMRMRQSQPGQEKELRVSRSSDAAAIVQWRTRTPIVMFLHGALQPVPSGNDCYSTVCELEHGHRKI